MGGAEKEDILQTLGKKGAYLSGALPASCWNCLRGKTLNAVARVFSADIL